MYSSKRNGSNLQDLPLAETLKPDAQEDAPGDDAPEDAAAPADAPKVRLGQLGAWWEHRCHRFHEKSS